MIQWQALPSGKQWIAQDLRPELPEHSARARESIHFLQCFGFSPLQVRLPNKRGLCGIHSRFQLSFLEEVAPALVAVLGALALFVASQFPLRVLPPFDDLDYSGGQVGSDVMENDDVGSVGFVACQKDSVPLFSEPLKQTHWSRL